MKWRGIRPHSPWLATLSSFPFSDPAAGASDDWYRGGLGTRYSYTTELRDTGLYGFLLPPGQIVPSGEELFAGMKVVFEKCVADSRTRS